MAIKLYNLFYDNRSRKLREPDIEIRQASVPMSYAYAAEVVFTNGNGDYQETVEITGKTLHRMVTKILEDNKEYREMVRDYLNEDLNFEQL